MNVAGFGLSPGHSRCGVGHGILPYTTRESQPTGLIYGVPWTTLLSTLVAVGIGANNCRSAPGHTPDPVWWGLFPSRSRPGLLTPTVDGGLNSPPRRRFRRDVPHLSHSSATACSLAVLLRSALSPGYPLFFVSLRRARRDDLLHQIRHVLRS